MQAEYSAASRRNGCSMGRRRATAVFILAGISAGTMGMETVHAGEHYCVTCTAPDAHYDCQVETGNAAIAGAALQLYCIKQLARRGGHESCSVKRRPVAPCTGQLKILDYEQADGTITQLNIRAPSVGPASNAPAPAGSAMAGGSAAATATGTQSAQPAGPPPAPAETTAPAAQQKPPATVEELAKRTAQSAGSELQKASKAVGDSAKNATGAVGSAIKNTGKAVGSAVKKTGQGVAGAAKKTWTCVTTLFQKC